MVDYILVESFPCNIASELKEKGKCPVFRAEQQQEPEQGEKNTSVKIDFWISRVVEGSQSWNLVYRVFEHAGFDSASGRA